MKIKSGLYINDSGILLIVYKRQVMYFKNFEVKEYSHYLEEDDVLIKDPLKAIQKHTKAKSYQRFAPLPPGLDIELGMLGVSKV